MINLPSIVTLKPDELLYSYILRLSKANGFKTLADFTSICLTKTKRTLSYDVGYNLYHLLHIINFEDIQSFYLYTTIFPGISPLNNRTTTSYYLSNHPITPMISELKYCPKCIKDGYYKRAHQMPGVTVCYKHNCALHTYIGEQGKELDFPLKHTINPIYSKSHEYAVFCKDFLNSNIQTDLPELLRLIRTNKDLDTEMIDYLELMSELPSSFLKATTATSKNHNKTSLLTILMFLYKNVETLMKYINPNPVSINSNYKLLSSYREDLIEVKCLSCKNPFLATPSKIKCPICNTYKIQTRNTNTFRTTKNINDIPLDFSIVGYTNKSSSITIKHNTCNQTFRCNFYTFYNNPKCKICQPQIRTEASFKNDIKSLTGNDYTLISSYIDKNTKVEIKHNTCNKTHLYYPKHFLDGSRCPYCKPFIRTENLDYIISNISYGKLSLDNKYNKNLINIRNLDTNEIITISPNKAIQELIKPTKSNILPLEKRDLSTPIITTKKNIILNYLKSNYTSDNLIFLEDVIINDISYVTIKKSFETLVDKQILFRIEKGIYSFEDKPISTDKLIDEKYLLRGNKRIGYICGETLAYKLGLRNNKPNQLDIITNKEAGTHGRTIIYNNTKIKIHGSKVKITNENYAILATINFLINEKRLKYTDKGNINKTFFNWLNNLNIKQSDFEEYYKYFPKWSNKYIDAVYKEGLYAKDK